MIGNTTPFVKLLETIFHKLPTRSLINSTEQSLENIIKLLWFERQCITQLHLVADPNKQWGNGQNAFPDIFGGNSPHILVIELKNVSLGGLWKARYPNRKSRSEYDFEPLVKELSNATLDELLDLKYSFYDKAKKRWFTEQVKDTLQSATAQLNRYISIISCGKGETPYQGKSGRSGVLDNRVECFHGGHDELWGYVIICVGTRVICRHTVTEDTEYLYGLYNDGLWQPEE